MNKITSLKALTMFHFLSLFMFVVLLIVKAFTSIDWRMEHDTPLLHYAAFLMDKHDMFPYRDIFETSMPGTFVFHYMIGAYIGYGDATFRFVDLTILLSLLLATYFFMNRFGKLVAIWAMVIFGLVYLSQGQAVSLQRDYIGVIPISISLLCIPSRTNTTVSITRFLLVGLLFGASILIKPHLALSLPIIFTTLIVYRWSSRNRSISDLILCSTATIVSLSVPIAISLIWLASNSAIEPFLDMFFNYIPLHSAISGGQETISGLNRFSYVLAKTTTIGGYGVLFLCSLFACFRILESAEKNETTATSLICLMLCVFAYAIYPALAGKFWEYHYLPFAYFCSVTAGLCVYTRPQNTEPLLTLQRKSSPWAIPLILALTVQLPLYSFVSSVISDLKSGPTAHSPKGGRVDEIAKWLKPRLQVGDTVQPLDWTGGSIHAMLLVEAKLATQFMYDYHFYHHTSSPTNKKLRTLFINQLSKSAPRFIIEVDTNKPWVWGKDSTREFPELHQFIDNNYDLACTGDGYIIYEILEKRREVSKGLGTQGYENHYYQNCF